MKVRLAGELGDFQSLLSVRALAGCGSLELRWLQSVLLVLCARNDTLGWFLEFFAVRTDLEYLMSVRIIFFFLRAVELPEVPTCSP